MRAQFCESLNGWRFIMTMDVLRDNPELRQFVLSNARLTGTRIGSGAYGSVEEIAIPGAICAAKKIHEVFLDRSEMPLADIRKASAQFVKECQLMSTLRHPNIVQFLGVCFFPGSRMPALVMERLLTSPHDLLDPEIDPPPPPDASKPRPKPFFPLSLKCSILHNVGSGLAYLHERAPPIIHRDLSARNVLLNSGMVAKIADLGVARIVPHMRSAATMTKAPGASVYMPPEALEDKSEQEEDEKGKTSKYDASIDVFSFGVVSIFTLSQTFPCKLLAPNYREGGKHIARTELDRREHYMRMIYSQLREQHPLLQMIERCLDFPEDRPSIFEVLHLLEQARADDRDEQTEMDKLELLRALQTQPRNQSLERDLQSCVQEITELQQQVQSSEREKQTIRQQLTEELTRAEETIRREQQQRQQETELVRAKDREITQAQQQIQKMRQQDTEKDELVQAKERELTQAQQQIQKIRHKDTEKDELVQAKERELSQAQEQLREKEEQLRSSATQVADFQKSLQQKDSQLESLNTKGTALASQTSTDSTCPPAIQSTALGHYITTMPTALQAVPHSFPNTTPRKLTVQFHCKKIAPCKMFRGSAITDHQYSYFTPDNSNSVYSYQWSADEWKQLPPCPYRYSALVVINGELTAVGGWDGSYRTSALVTLRQRQWVCKYPPMNTVRSYTTAVGTSDGEYIIAIGGCVGGGHWTTAVELFQVSSRRWYSLSELPKPLALPSATICGNQLHVIADDIGYSCSLRALLSTERQIKSPLIPHLISWTSLPRLPMRQSTAATLSGQLVIVGGRQGSSVVDCKSFHQLLGEQWVEIGSMFCGRRWCLVVSPSPDKIMIVGGYGYGWISQDITEDCISV